MAGKKSAAVLIAGFLCVSLMSVAGAKPKDPRTRAAGVSAAVRSVETGKAPAPGRSYAGVRWHETPAATNAAAVARTKGKAATPVSYTRVPVTADDPASHSRVPGEAAGASAVPVLRGLARQVAAGGEARAACSIDNMKGASAVGWTEWPVPGSVLKIYVDPDDCGGTAYPFLIQSIDIPSFTDAAGFGLTGGLGTLYFSVGVECPDIGGDSCSGPGTELFRSSNIQLVADDSGLHSFNVPVNLCVEGPFFVSIHWESWTGDPTLVPSPLWDGVPRPRGRQWISTDSGAIWTDFTDFWLTGGQKGWVDIIVNGNTEDTCVPGGNCSTNGPSTGACCVDGACIGNTTEAACAGDWFICEDCATYTHCSNCINTNATITVDVTTDNYPLETTWELVEQGSGYIAGSGGPYADQYTYYSTDVAVCSELCYDFTIFDAIGDGICCDYGNGHYEVYYEGGLVGSGGEFGLSETVSDIGDGCGPPPTGACCVAEVCVATNTQVECDGLGGMWYVDQDCATFTCPPDPCADALYANGAFDGVNALYAEREPYGAASRWVVDDVVFTTNVEINDLHWWGNEATAFNWTENIDYIILNDDNGAPGTVVTEVLDVSATRVDTGVTLFTYPVWLYSVQGLSVSLSAGTYWVGMRVVEDPASAEQGWWLTAADNGTSYCYKSDYAGAPWEPSPDDFQVAFCVTGVEVPDCIPAGDDCWVTTCGLTTYGFADTPLPEDFFYQGSDQFIGVVQLGGGGSGPFGTDTTMSRLSEICFAVELPSIASTPIELTALDLVSCAPITVTSNGMYPELWDVTVGLSATGPVPQGTMTVTKTHTNGGTFDADFYVQPVFTFTKVSDPGQVRVFDTGLEGIPPTHLSTAAAPWLQVVPGASTCSPDFAPGYRTDESSDPCCEEICHDTSPPSDKVHCVRPPDCTLCPEILRACCDPFTGTCIGDLTEEECANSNGDWHPNATCGADPELPLAICNYGCTFDGGQPLDDLGGPASQYAPDYPFTVGAADDFILNDPGENPCRINQITTWTTHWGAIASPALYTGINLTVYAHYTDADPPGPGGQPTNPPDGSHTEYFSGGIVHSEFVGTNEFSYAQILPSCLGDLWQIDIPVDFLLEKNVAYWLEIQPIMNFFGTGQVAIALSQNSTGYPAQQIFPGVGGISAWTEVSGNTDACSPDTPAAGTRRDLAFIIYGEEVTCFAPAPAGDDCWTTQCGWGTQYDFSQTPIPANFFYEGSDPFSDIVELGAGTAFPDTVIARLDDMCFDGTLPVVAQTAIRLVQLDLVSCQPIPVTSNGVDPQYWDLRVFAHGHPQPAGTLTATMIDSNGGTFDSTIPVRAGFEFTGPGGPLSFLPGAVPTLTATGLPWVHVPPPFAICGNGGFFPGMSSDSPSCCDPSCHVASEPGHVHCVIPPDCQPCPTACCLPDGSCADLPADVCVNTNGTPHVTDMCTAPAACCLADGTCIDTDPLCCADQDGATQGPGSTCATITACPDGDFDEDDDVDLSDFGVFQRCFGQTGLSPLCAIGDFDANDTINLDDYERFEAWMTGP